MGVRPVWNKFTDVIPKSYLHIAIQTKDCYYVNVYCVQDQIDDNFYIVEKDTNCIIRQIDIRYDTWSYI